MTTFKESKQVWIQSLINLGLSEKEISDQISGFEVAENLVEEKIRYAISPYSQLIKALSKIIDTKKESKREELLSYILENPNTIQSLKNNLSVLINIVRL